MTFRSLATALALVSAFGASAIGAQMPGAAAKAAAQRAADSANAQLSRETGQAVPQHNTQPATNADIAARLRSMKSQNVAPIKTGSASQAPSQQPATQQPAPQQVVTQQPAPQKSAAAIPKTRTPNRSSLTGAPAAPARSSSIQQHVAETPATATPTTPVAPPQSGSAQGTKPNASTKPVESAAPKSVATTKPVESAPKNVVTTKPPVEAAPANGKPVATAKNVEAPVKPGTESVPTKRSADTSVMQQGNTALAKTAPVPPAGGPKRDSVLVMREQFSYDRDGRRDPFVSLMTTTDLRPTISDLRLTSVLYDQSGRRPVAIMRDSIANVQWRVTTGMTLGRMRVSSIRPRVVVFTIEEFGFSRQDSLMLRDTTRVRSK